MTRTQQQLDTQATNAQIVALALGGVGLARGVAGGVAGLARGLTGADGVQVARSSARLSDLVEANAQRRLTELEASNPGAHFLSRHGAQTTLDSQYDRAFMGQTPDGYPGNPVNSSRFLSHQDQLNAIQRAQTIYRQTGQVAVRSDAGQIIGEGFTANGLTYTRTSNVFVLFRNGLPYTAYPDLRPLP